MSAFKQVGNYKKAEHNAYTEMVGAFLHLLSGKCS